MMPPERTGRIITFYSYKGGTGRTMLVANVAWILASNGKRVLLLDWDLEAPGLHRYLAPFLLDRELTASPGIIDMVTEYADETMTRADQPDEPFDAADFFQFVVSLQAKFRPPGALDFVPAGRQGPGYAARVGAFNWQNFYDRLGGGAFLHEVTEAMRKEYDYVLIDSRTGVSDTSGICTVQLPDDLVVCFTANNQSIEGASAIARSVLDQRAGRPMRVFPVLTRVEDGETRKLERARDRARQKFGEFLDHLDPSQHEAYWSDVEVPYRVLYAYEELLACFGDRPLLHSTVLSAAEKLTARLTGGEVTRLVPPDEEERARVLAEFERPPSGAAAPEPAGRAASAPARAATEPEAAGRTASARPRAATEPEPAGRAASAPPRAEPAPSPAPTRRWWALGVGLALALMVALAVGGSLLLPPGSGGSGQGAPPDASAMGVASSAADAAASPAGSFDLEGAWKQAGAFERLLALTSLPESLSPENRQYAELVARRFAAGAFPVAVLQGEGQERPLLGARFGLESGRIVTAAIDGRVRVWRADGGGLVRTIETPGGALSRFDAAGGAIALAADVNAWIYAEDPAIERYAFRPSADRVTDVRLKPDGRYLLRATASGSVAVSFLERTGGDLMPRGIAQLTADRRFSSILFAGDTLDLVSLEPGAAGTDGAGGKRGKVIVWRSRSGKYLDHDIEETGGPEEQVVLSDRGDMVAFTTGDGQTSLLRVRGDGKLWPEKVRLAGREGPTKLLAVRATADDAGVCAAVSSEGRIQAWKWKGASPVPVEIAPVQLGQRGGARALALSPDGERLVVAAANGHAYVHGIEEGGALDLEGDGHPLQDASFSPDGTRVVTTVEEANTAWIWQLPVGAPAAGAPFEDVVQYLGGRTRQCLPADRRAALLGETPAEAEKGARACAARPPIEAPPPATVSAPTVTPPRSTVTPPRSTATGPAGTVTGSAGTVTGSAATVTGPTSTVTGKTPPAPSSTPTTTGKTPAAPAPDGKRKKL